MFFRQAKCGEIVRSRDRQGTSLTRMAAPERGEIEPEARCRPPAQVQSQRLQSSIVASASNRIIQAPAAPPIRRRSQCFQSQCEIARRLKTLLRLLFQAMTNDSFDTWRNNNLWIVLKFRRVFFKNRVHGLYIRIAFERAPARDHFIEHSAEREDIRTMVCGQTANLLGRHISHRSQHHPWLGCGGRHDGVGGSGSFFGQFREPEIKNLDPAVDRDENIVWLHIAMKDSLVMSRGEAARQLCAIIDGDPSRQPAVSSSSPNVAPSRSSDTT